jgi:Viral BACON domain/Secretion system C-terminal sorting domain/Putative binding domain, N-terminal/Cysteine-rich secretory protein family
MSITVFKRALIPRYVVIFAFYGTKFVNFTVTHYFGFSITNKQFQMNTIFTRLMVTGVMSMLISALSPLSLMALSLNMDTPPAVLSVLPLTASNKSATFSTTFTITASAAWTVSKEKSAAWVTIGTKATNKVTVSFAANTTLAARTATITFLSGALSQVVKVSQEAAIPPAVLTVTAATTKQPTAGGTLPITVTSSGAWIATKPLNTAWFTLSTLVGIGNATVTATLQANTTPSIRTVTISFLMGTLTKTVTITQEASAVTAQLSVSPESVPIAGTGDNSTLNLTANGAWSIVKAADATWLNITPLTGQKNEKIIVSAAANPTTLVRSTVVTVISGLISKKVTITQGGGIAPVTDTPAACDRDAIISAYKTNFVGSTITDQAELGWNGNAANCNPGTISAVAQAKTLQRINYFRKLVGLQDVTFDNTLTAGCQAGALILDANDKLTHQATSSWKCYTPLGATALTKSNTIYGSTAYSPNATASGAIKLFIDDYLSYSPKQNREVGHRRWILYSKAKTFAHGATDQADALLVVGAFSFAAATPAFIAYPPKGYMPRSLLVPRWSFSIPVADFSKAKVTVLDDANNELTVVQQEVANGYGDNTISWDIPESALAFTSSEDKVFKVKISGVKIAGVTQKDYKYNVIAIDETPSNVNILTETTATGRNLTADFQKGAKSYLWSNGATTKSISVASAGEFTVTVTDKNGCAYSPATNQLAARNESDTYKKLLAITKRTPGEDISVGNTVDESLVNTNLTETITVHKTKISIFPNPVDDRLFINIDNPEKYADIKVEMLDVSGQVIKTIQQKLNGTSERLDINTGDIQSGMYIFKTSLGNKLHVNKVVKQ